MQNPSDFASYHQSILNKLFYGKQTCEKLLPALSNKDFKVNIYGHSVQFFQFSCSVMSDSLWPHELQPARPPCPSPTPRVHSNSCPSSQWCHPAISSSVVPFSSCPQSLPASESFPMSQLFAWGGQSTGVSASASVPPKPLTVWITINCGKFWKRWEYQTTWPASWETYMQVRKQQLELDMEQQTGSR